jgi:transcriptional regulator with XRE-family HTH domain
VNYKHNQAYVTSFGDHLRKVRQEKGLSMRQLAAKAEIEYKQLSLIEHGEINTTISTAFALAEALEIPVKDLFDLPAFSVKTKISKEKE